MRSPDSLVLQSSLLAAPSNVNIHLQPDLTMRNVIIALCCNFSILTAGVVVDSTTNPPATAADADADACDLVNRDLSKCYFYRRSLRLNFADAVAFCAQQFQSQLPSEFDLDDESRIAQDLGLDFWSAARFRLHHEETQNRIQLLNPEANFTAGRWDFTSINLTIFWLNDSYCALATHNSDHSSGTGNTIFWAPKDCNQTATSVLCEKRLFPQPTAPTTHPPNLRSGNLLNETLSDGLVGHVLDANSKSHPQMPENGLLISSLLIFLRSNYYAERVKRELIAGLVAGLVLTAVLFLIRLVMRKLRRSSSAFFTVQGMALVYVRSDLPEQEIPRNTCTSFIIRGCE